MALPPLQVPVRYAIAIAVTAGLMIWQSGDAVRAGMEMNALVVFWLVSVTTGWLQMIVIARGVRASFGADRWPGWALLVASALIGAIPLSFEIRWMVETLVAPVRGLPPPWVTYLNVTVINLVFSLIQYVLIEGWPLTGLAGGIVNKKDQPTEPGPAQVDTLPAIGRLRRLPDGVSGVIRYMQMQDHYLHVHTDQGTGMVLGRMGDAVADLAGTDGLQVHKSWWVSRAAIERIEQEQRKRTIHLPDGTAIPVGRSFEPALRAAGWI